MKWLTVLGVLVCSSLHGEMNGAISLEWLVDASDAVGVYRVQATVPSHRASKAYDSSLDVALKGSPPSQVLLNPPRGRVHAHYNTKLGDRLVVFFTSERVRQAINVTNAEARDHSGAAVTADFRLLDTESSILDHVVKRIEIGRTIPAPPASDSPFHRRSEHWKLVSVPRGSEAFHPLWLGSSVGLIVPTEIATNEKEDLVNCATQPETPLHLPLWLVVSGTLILILMFIRSRRRARRPPVNARKAHDAEEDPPPTQ